MAQIESELFCEILFQTGVLFVDILILLNVLALLKTNNNQGQHALPY